MATLSSGRVEVYGVDELDRSDMILPRLRVRQQTSQFGAPSDAGALYNNITEGFQGEVEAVILRVSKGRVMWDADDMDTPKCASNNNKTPRDDIADPVTDNCATCPMAIWGDDMPPECSLVYTYLIANISDDNMPMLLSAMRTSIKAAKKLNSLIMAYGLSRKVIITTEFCSGDKGQWYELRFRAGDKLIADEVDFYSGLATNMAAIDVTVDTEPELDADDLDPDNLPDGAEIVDLNAPF